MSHMLIVTMESIKLSVRLSIIMLSVIMLSVIMLCVVMLNVVAPSQPSPMFVHKARSLCESVTASNIRLSRKKQT
jgi:hypothetical protein